MLRLYRSLIRCKLDYGCIVYGSARKSYLQMLDLIHNQGLRLCLGAFRTSPVESLYIDAHEPCLGARRAKLSLHTNLVWVLDVQIRPEYINHVSTMYPWHDCLEVIRSSMSPCRTRWWVGAWLMNSKTL